MEKDFNHLRDYLATLAATSKDTGLPLPLYHTAPFIFARDYIHFKKLYPIPCDVCEQDLVYLFLGRAEYRDYKSPHLKHYRPIVFVFKPAAVQSHLSLKIFPFDTGAVREDRYAPEIKKDDYDIVRTKFLVGKGLELKHAYMLINILYESPAHYVNQTIREDSQIKFDERVRPEMASIKKIHSKEFVEADPRKSAIELQLDKGIDFTRENVMKIIAPGIVISNYKELQDLLNDLGLESSLPLQIKGDNTSLMEDKDKGGNVDIQGIYTDIRRESIQISISQCTGN